MTILLKSAVVAAALAVAGPLQAKSVTLTVQIANYYGPPTYAAAYVTDPKGKYVTTLYVAGRRAQYLADLRGWYRLIRRSGRGIDGTTGASVGAGGRFSTTVNLPDKMLNAGYTLHIETAIEDYGSVPNDAVVPLDNASNGKPVQGQRNVAAAMISF